MPIYEYETVPTRKGEKTKRYEIRQCMEDEPLTAHPETGETIRSTLTPRRLAPPKSKFLSAVRTWCFYS